ncbi:helix-turn-helix transcriptional regulator [Microbacterium suaedae]|uniref:helix-turn-helix transcriptional regulator n=1 Tax=Microbacterium suaedae TaxID=2067813 RepID=UPI000DA1870F|nr:LuxR C-terminal-related transcriptional regulator [Microbacterium suaedae]
MALHREQGIVMVCGGAGSGKTSALVAWAQNEVARGSRIAWVTLDTELRQREVFWSAAMQRLAAAGSDIDDDLLRALQQPPGAMTRALLPLLLAQFSPDRERATLVVDRGDLAVETPLSDDLISLSTQGSSLRIVFTTRRSPDAIPDDERTRHRFAASPPELLVFDREETSALAAFSNRSHTDHDIEVLHAATGGWPLAVRAELDDRATSPAHRTVGSATQQIGARLVDELRTDPSFPSLLPLSVAEVLDEPLARALGASDDTLRMMDDCAIRGLGSWEDDGQRRRFRFQPVLRKALRQELTAAHPQTARRSLAALAAELEERDERLAAFAASIDAEDWARASRLYRRRMSGLAVRETAHSEILRRIPPSAQREHPLLMFAVAHDDFIMGRHAAAFRGFERFLTTAAELGRYSARPSVDTAWIQCFVTLTLRLLGRHDKAASATIRLMGILEQVDDPTRELDEAASMFLSQAAVSLLMADRSERALTALDEAGIDVLPDRPVVERARIFSMRSLVTSQRGEIATTTQLLDELGDLPLPPGYGAACTTVPSTIANARALIEQGRGEAAEEHLRPAEAYRRASEFWPYLLECAVRARLLRVGPAETLAFLDQQLAGVLTHLRASVTTSAMLTTLRIDLLLAQQRIVDARLCLAESPHRRSRLSDLARARVRLFDGDAASAASIAARALRLPGTPLQEMSFSLIAAAASLRLSDDEQTVIRHVSRSVDIAHRENLSSPFTTIPGADLQAVLAHAPDLRIDIPLFPGYAMGAPVHVDLTPRERVVLDAIAEGRSVAETAAELSVSANTVKAQRRSLYRKLGVSSSAAALDEARRRHVF